MTEPARAACEDCGSGFDYAAPFYAERQLAAPRRCPSCRAQRRARRVSRRGVVFRIGDRFGLVRADADGALYFAPDLTSESGLRAGDPVAFSIDPGERPEPGRKVRAFDVRPEA